MVVGVPGTGIGGLFYLLMGLSMPFVEAWRWARGDRPAQGGKARWRFIAGQIGLLGSIVAAMTVQAIIAREVFSWWAAATSSKELARELGLLVNQHTVATAGFATFASITMLTLVILGVHVLRLTVGRRAKNAMMRRG
ncbi:MAG: hypothetical protein ACKVZJ_09745 [Phycisphaerales bacterium]